MTSKKPFVDRLRAFGMSGLQVQDDLTQVEDRFSLELRGREPAKVSREIEGYGQFEAELRRDAVEMSEYYEVFYCLENTIRDLVSGILKEEFGVDWWEQDCVKPNIKNEVNSRRQKELDASFSPRSEREIDFTTFGELSQLITDNWTQFAPIFDSKAAVSRVMNELNVLRGPIAHCCLIDELEKDRLRLVVRNWLRIVS